MAASKSKESKTITKLLVANRGEIACRVMRTARQLGIKTVAVYSDADAKAQHVKQADEAVAIGSAPSKESYLQIDRVIAAAKQTGADAVHPGYGFLSENAEFAEACANHDLIFVGPPAAAINAMGSKSAAKQIMQEAGVPLLPGYHGSEQTLEVLKTAADDMGYPVLLKAVAGGGGKGMRQVASSAEFAEALTTAKREAMSSFGNDDMLVEKFLTRPRHVEVQVFFDSHGDGVYLFERDCSVQRRHQKIIEEAPAPGVDQDLRKLLGEAAVKAAAAINYVGAGTVEFLLDEDGTFYFMEMNTRLQVEHPVTEYITGQDLVAWQLTVAIGGQLPLTQDELTINGHAFEARIYAEDPANEFLPQTGLLNHCSPPTESRFVRVDSGVVSGDEISVHYDPMIAKLVTWDEDRDRALTRMVDALTSYQISGVTTNIDFLKRLANHESFRAANLSTAFIGENEAALFQDDEITPDLVARIALYLVARLERNQDSNDPWQSPGWTLNAPRRVTQKISIGDELFSVGVRIEGDVYQLSVAEQEFTGSISFSGNNVRVTIDGGQSDASVYFDGVGGKWFSQEAHVVFAIPEKDFGEASLQTDADFSAPMNGTVVEVAVSPGDQVAAGDLLVVLEAMKMEHAIHAPAAGTVTELFCSAGQLVDGGATLLAFEVAENA